MQPVHNLDLLVGKLYTLQAQTKDLACPKADKNTTLEALIAAYLPISAPPHGEVAPQVDAPKLSAVDLTNVSKALTNDVSNRVKFGARIDQNRLRANLLPVVMAKGLVNEEGELTLNNFESLKSTLFVRGNSSNQQVIENVVKELSHLGTSYEALLQVEAPDDDNQAALETIACMLGLGADVEITDAHARICALSACFAEAAKTSIDNDISCNVATALKSCRLTNFIEDINSFLKYGFIERNVEGFPQTLDLGLNGKSEALLTNVEINVRGSITNRWFGKDNDKIWQNAGVIEACKVVGIENPEASILKALPELIDQSKSRDTLCIKDLIEALSEDEELQARAKLAFTCVFENPLMRSWQNALNGLASIRPSYIRAAKIHEAVRDLLVTEFKDTEDARVDARLQKAFSTFLDAFHEQVIDELPSDSRKVQDYVIKALPADALDLAKITHIKDVVVHSEDFLKGLLGTVDFKPVALDAESLVKVYAGSKSVRISARNALDVFAMLLSAPNNSYIKTPNHIVRLESQAMHEALKGYIMSEKNRHEVYQVLSTFISDEVLKATFEIGMDAEIGSNWDMGVFREEVLVRIPEFITSDMQEAVLAMDAVLAKIFNKTLAGLVVPFTTSDDLNLVFHRNPVTKEVVIGQKRDNVLESIDQDDFIVGDWEVGQIDA